MPLTAKKLFDVLYNVDSEGDARRCSAKFTDPGLVAITS